MKLIIFFVFILIAIATVVASLVYTQSRYGKGSLVEHTEIVQESYDGNARTLAVVLHAFSKTGESLNDVAAIIQDQYAEGGVNIIQPDLPLGVLSTASTGKITAELISAISKEWKNKQAGNQPYERIIFVGHSFGALFVRKLLVVANGEYPESPFEEDLSRHLIPVVGSSLENTAGTIPPQPWINKVERLILLAGMNRGWSISHHMSIPRALQLQAGVILGYLIELVSGELPTILTIRRGGSFITQLRLQWLQMQHERSKSAAGMPTTVQLLGTIDDLVAPDDNVDMVTGKDFVYLEVPETGHKDIINLIDNTNETNRVQAANRKVLFEQALEVTKETAPDQSIFITDLNIREDIDDVVFVIHGIRDLGHWTTKIARRTQALANTSPEKRKIATETSTYGYFPMLSFLIPGARQQKVEWFMDRYTEAKARYPNARFHYVGHSHGTYLLAKALKDYKAVKFDNVVFAGSVVRKKYEWDQYIPQRIKNLQNFVASADWVVAIFPNAFQKLNWQDLGSAGHDGFSLSESLNSLYQPDKLVNGGHSAAIDEQMWDPIAHFILNGEPTAPHSSLMIRDHSKTVSTFSKYALGILAAIVVIFLVIVPYFLFTMDIREWKKTVFIISYAMFVWLVITRV